MSRERVVRSKAEWALMAALVLLVAVAPLIADLRVKIGSVPVEPVILAMAVAIVAAIPFLRRLGASRLPSNPIEIPALAFIGFSALTVLFSSSIASSALTWVRYAMYIVVALVVAAACVRAENRRLLSWAFMAAGVVTMGVAAWQLLVPTAASMQFAVDAEAKVRVYSLFHNPNPYSEYLMFYIAVALVLAMKERGALRYLAGALLACGTVTLFFTYTRGSWLGLAVGAVIGLSMISFRTLIGFAVSGGVLLLAVPGALQRLVTGLTVNDSTDTRLGLWNLAVHMIQTHPITGVGLGRYDEVTKLVLLAIPSLGIGLDAITPHNSYLLLAAETGVLGGLLYAWLIWRVCRMGLAYGRIASADRHVRNEVAGYTIAIVGFAFAALTNNTFQNPPAVIFFWVLLGMQMGTVYRLLAVRVPEADAQIGAKAERVKGAWLRSLGETWRRSPLFAMPRTGGRLLASSRLGRTVLGPGATDVPDLADWDAR
ncbi:MAG: hypothetical protein HGA39_08040 [Coriobacteriia bacterium]|nr:hypothetical protein [Coriobacteriia bacterium]